MSPYPRESASSVHKMDHQRQQHIRDIELAGALAASRQYIIDKTLVSAHAGEGGWKRRGAFLLVLETADRPAVHCRGNCYGFGGYTNFFFSHDVEATLRDSFLEQEVEKFSVR